MQKIFFCILILPRKKIDENIRKITVPNCRNAGVGLALLYMTVLGFDNVTYGFLLTQGVGENILGLLVGASAMVGVAGSLAYPFIRK